MPWLVAIRYSVSPRWTTAISPDFGADTRTGRVLAGERVGEWLGVLTTRAVPQPVSTNGSSMATTTSGQVAMDRRLDITRGISTPGSRSHRRPAQALPSRSARYTDATLLPR